MIISTTLSTVHKLRPKAELLRKQGYSYRFIEEKLGITRSTMSYWFKDQPFNPNKEVLRRMKTGPAKVGILRHNARVKEIKRLRKEGILQLGALSRREKWILGIGIYIGEGSKSSEIIRISNADPAVIRLGVKWFQESCGLLPDNLTVRLHIYPDNDENECIKYWQGVTGLPRKNFGRTSVDMRKDKQKAKVRRLPYGTAHVTVVSNGDPEKGRKLFRRISGWMAGALNQ